MTSPDKEIIHIAIANQSAMLADPDLGLENFRVGYINGATSEVTQSKELVPSEYGRKVLRMQEAKYIEWGDADPKKYIAYEQTKPIIEFYKKEGNFTVTKLILQIRHTKKIIDPYGMPHQVNTVLHHCFDSWNFSPGQMQKIFDHIPSHPLYLKIKKTRNEWVKKTGDQKTADRFRSTWLVNEMPQGDVPISYYNMWYTRGALVIPEKWGVFQGRELRES